MLLDALNARNATEIGGMLATRIADQLAGTIAVANDPSFKAQKERVLKSLLLAVDRDVRPLRLNFFQKSRFANTFKWTLIEKGCDPMIADELVHRMLMQLAVKSRGPVAVSKSPQKPSQRAQANEDSEIVARGDAYFAQGELDKAISVYQQLIERNPRHADALNNLATILYRKGRYDEAENLFKRAIRVKPDFAQAHWNLGLLLRTKGEFVEAECSYRQALKFNPRSADAEAGLGLTDILQGQTHEGKQRLEKVLRQEPTNVEALLGLAYVARVEGEFEYAESLLKRVLAFKPSHPAALAGIASTRTMRLSDADWIKEVERVLANGVAPSDERELRFAAGKYFDDVQMFELAFRHFKRANELSQANAPRYEKDKDTQFVSSLIKSYTQEALQKCRSEGSTSRLPVFVVGMPRSGTSLIEQIIASHPFARGAGELSFWNDFVWDNDAAVRKGPLSAPLKQKLANDYLRVLTSRFGDVQRIVDKAPVNARYLGLIHSVFPNARIIHVQRDPIDTCLSCYFQPFHSGMSFTFDLSSLAHYYKEQYRLMAHWRAVLPKGVMLDVPYETMVKAPDEWTHDILEFLDLPWDDRCLNFHDTKRMVATASYWQVRQKIYQHSVERWRKYEKFLDPLMELKGLR